MKTMTQKQFCQTYNLTINQFNGTELIKVSLYLDNITEIPSGFNPTVGNNLFLNSIKEIPDGFNPTISGRLCLNSVTEIPIGFNPTVGGHLFINSVTEIPIGFNPTVGGNLYLNSIIEIPVGFNPIVGGSLNLYDLMEIPVGFNPIVGGSLNLNSIKEIPSGFNPTVGGSLYFKNNDIYINKKLPLYSWQNEKYIKVDGIFNEVISHKGNLYKVKEIGYDEEYYIVTDGNGIYAHGETLEEAKADLSFKILSATIKNTRIKPDTIINKQYYRVVTGACEYGCDKFIKQYGLKKEYRADELIEILEEKNAYGYERLKELIDF